MNWRAASLGMVCVLWVSEGGRGLDQPMAIVVSKSNPTTSLTLIQLRRVFTRQDRFWRNGEPMVPVDWEASSEIRKQFSKKVHGKSVLEMRDFWIQQSITAGLNPPTTLKSARAILRFVASVAGAISYLPADEVDDSVKTIKVYGLE